MITTIQAQRLKSHEQRQRAFEADASMDALRSNRKPLCFVRSLDVTTSRVKNAKRYNLKRRSRATVRITRKKGKLQ